MWGLKIQYLKDKKIATKSKRRLKLKVIKRDGRVVDYDRNKITIAIEKANNEVIEEKEKASK